MKALLVALFFFQAADMPLVQPKDLAAHLEAHLQPRPAIFHVGPNVLYRSKHIPGAVYAGPGSKPEGLAMLKSAAANLPRTREIAIYCGCCPWDRCPNVKPAMEVLKQMGFTKVKALYLENNFASDWIDKGYPVEH
ncbi:MAG TPA: rhodanese-like domain-containing protein [Candidatus Solibacter sp.]|nr:rhodanese-like domain-containing protein [Candidatus Solibacter sp.]